jgi:hypothetical protein
MMLAMLKTGYGCMAVAAMPAASLHGCAALSSSSHLWAACSRQLPLTQHVFLVLYSITHCAFGSLLLPCLQLMEGQLDEWMDAFHTMLSFSHPGLAAADAAGAQCAVRAACGVWQGVVR